MLTRNMLKAEKDNHDEINEKQSEKESRTSSRSSRQNTID